MVAEVVRENLEHLQPWMPWAVDDYSVANAKEWIRQTYDGLAQDGQFSALIFFDDKFVGTIGFHDLDLQNKRAAVGYWIDRSYEGRGIITRCCGVLIDYLFDRMDLNRLQINCAAENTRSRAIPERLGFTLEGTFRQYEFREDRSGDWVVYGLLKSERRAGKV